MASLVAQMVKNLPVMQETRLQFLGWKIPWRKEWYPTPGFLPGESHGQRNLAGYSSWHCKELGTTEQLTPTTLSVQFSSVKHIHMLSSLSPELFHPVKLKLWTH